MVLEVIGRAIGQGEKSIQIRKEEIRLSLFADDMIIYIENPKNSIKKPVELTKEFSNNEGYKINIQKSVALNIKNELSEKEIRKTVPFAIASKRIKCLWINLIKEVKDLYAEDNKALMKELTQDTIKWRHIPCSWIGKQYC